MKGSYASPNEIVPSLKDAIFRGFRWANTPEDQGKHYWLSVYNCLDKKSNRLWPHTADWSKAPKNCVARTMDPQGCCYFNLLVPHPDGNWEHHLVPCGKTEYVCNVNWEETLELNPNLI